MNRRRDRLMLLLALLSFPACRIEICRNDDDCRDWETRPGLCLYYQGTGPYCALPAPPCPSMYRWSSAADPSIKQKCVDPALIPKDAGADASPSDLATAKDD